MFTFFVVVVVVTPEKRCFFGVFFYLSITKALDRTYFVIMDKEADQQKLKDILSRFSQLEDNRRKFVDRWKETQEYVSPTVDNWDNLDAIPELPKRYSSDPCNYLNTLVSGIVGYSASPNIVWFKLTLEDQKDLKAYGVKDWLEEVEEIMNAEFNRSNFYSQIPSIVDQGATIGHGAMMTEFNTSKNKLHFFTIRSAELFLDVNAGGEIDTVFRKYVMTLRNVVEFFGLENVHENIKTDFEDETKWNNNITILFAVFPRKEAKKDFKTNLEMPYAAFYIDLTNQHIIQESGYSEMPYSIFEWNQIPGLAYSTSPATNALPDIKYLNIVKKTSMQICQTSAEPPMRISNSIRSLSIVPKGRNYITSPDEIIEPIKTGENYPITLQMLEDIKQSVKDWFNVDFFLMLQSKQGNMTATEVMELQGEKAAILSNIIVALKECLSTVIKRSFNLLYQNGIIPEIPESIRGNGNGMSVDFVGPLAQAQKKYHSMGGISSALQLINPIGQMFPSAMDYIDADELIKKTMNGQGMPQSIIREDKDVEDLRRRREEAQAQAIMQQQQQEMAQALISNAGQLSQPVQNGSPMQMLNEQLTGGFNA